MTNAFHIILPYFTPQDASAVHPFYVAFRLSEIPPGCYLMDPILTGIKVLQWSCNIFSHPAPNAPSLFGSLTQLPSLTILIVLPTALRTKKPAPVDIVPTLR